MGKPKLMLKKRRRSTVHNKKEAIPNSSATTRETAFDEMVLCDILSRLPVKSLMRFKCVSKRWCSLIKDPYFIDLHFNRSKLLGRLLFIIPPPKRRSKKRIVAGIRCKGYPVSFKLADLLSEVTGRAISNIHSIRTMKSFHYTEIVEAVNGLICFSNKAGDSVCVYNISTREVSPWVKPTSRDNDISGGINDFPTYRFGFDSVTKHYKIICNWRLYKKDGNYNVDDNIWEVLTLGDNSWRRIEEAPYGLPSSSIYVNGSIYWFPYMSEISNWGNSDMVCTIMAFDVGSEKFRKIRIPQFIIDQPNVYPLLLLRHVHLIEMNGCLAMLKGGRVSAVDIWIHENNDEEMSDESWKKRTINLPSYCFPTTPSESAVFFFHSVAGTKQLILEVHLKKSSRRTKDVSLYSYDWQNKTFAKLNISGIPSAIPVYISRAVCKSFIESLHSFSEAENIPSTQP